MYTDFYGLSFNPFDKQMVKEKDAFESEDFREMTTRLEYLKEIRGIGVFIDSQILISYFSQIKFSANQLVFVYTLLHLQFRNVRVCELLSPSRLKRDMT